LATEATVEAPAPHDNLTFEEAAERAALVSNLAYTLSLELSDDIRAETFTSVTEVTFDAAHENASTFIDLVARSVEEVTLNGRRLDDSQHLFNGRRLQLRGLRAGSNRLHVRAHCEYQHLGVGLHRQVDPMDGRVYLYTHFEPFDAHKVLACFDQPDLKATVTITVTTPPEWRVCSNGRVVSRESLDGRVITRFNNTPPIPPYLIAVVAGRFHIIESEHLGIPLRIWCRESMASWVEEQSADIFEVTRAGLDFFADYFGFPYPFDEYNQLFVPEFNMGAMENPGCVTFNDSYIFRGRPTDTQLERRAETVLHEMAHVHGFGDVTTMKWWGDLWLNETFATFMSVLAMVRATRFKNGWADFANTIKSVAARQDQLVTTHRIADDVPDTDSVRQNFDGITYHKGAAVMRQLVAWVGDDAFKRGVQDYFRRYRWGNATLQDFLDCLRRASGRDVSRFSREWLQTTGMNTLRPVFEVTGDTYRSFVVEQTAAPEHPTLRSHRIAIGLYERTSRGELRRRRQVGLDIDGPRTEVRELLHERAADLVIVNDDDLTFAKLRFDERSVQTLLGDLSHLPDPLARALCWAALWDMTRDAELAARRFVELVARHAPAEHDVLIVERILGQANAAIEQFGDTANRFAARRRLHQAARDQLEKAEVGGDLQVAWFRSVVATAVERGDRQWLVDLLDGGASVPGIQLDPDLRWLVLGHLSAYGLADAARINQEVARDPSDIGRRRGAACLAARPSAKAKAEAWKRILRPRSPIPREWSKAVDHEPSLAAMATLMSGFVVGSSLVAGFQARSDEPELLRPYVRRYCDALPEIWEQRTIDEAETFTEALYPRYLVGDDVVSRIDALLNAGTLPRPALRILKEGRDGTLRARRAQECDRAAGSAAARGLAE
jgi:aminopeptidase N